MPVTIHERYIWAQHVTPEKRAHAAAPPQPSPNPDWNPVGGVFVHHRGPWNPLGHDYESEDSCQRDIAYNFLVCPHGEIYEGRGHQHGEANSPGYIEENRRPAVTGRGRQPTTARAVVL